MAESKWRNWKRRGIIAKTAPCVWQSFLQLFYLLLTRLVGNQWEKYDTSAETGGREERVRERERRESERKREKRESELEKERATDDSSKEQTHLFQSNQ